MPLKNKIKKGFGMVEIIIASSIISITLLVLVSVYGSLARYTLTNIKFLKATQLAEEGIETLKYLRDSGWTQNIAALSNNTKYYLYWDQNVSSGTWTSTTSRILLENKYEVAFVLSPVYRDGSFNVVSSGGTLDSSTKKAVVTISWVDNNSTSTRSMETYLFNVFNN